MIYEPDENGQRRFVAEEYIIPYAMLPATASPPVLVGEEFQLHIGDQVWMLRVWIGRHNHDGMFATWSPQVSCRSAS